MKIYTLRVLITCLAFGGSTVAYALSTGITATGSTTLPGVKAKVEARMEANAEIKDIKVQAKENIKTIRAEVKSNLQILKTRIASSSEKRKEGVQKRLNNRFDNMTARFQATIDREVAISERISSRTEKIKAQGGNTDEADKFVADAIVNLTLAQSSLDSLKVYTEVAVGQESASSTRAIAKETFTAMRKAGADIEKYLHAAHKDLVSAVQSLIRISVGLHATTTIDANINS